jgi:hypothetical protein
VTDARIATIFAVIPALFENGLSLADRHTCWSHKQPAVQPSQVQPVLAFLPARGRAVG